MLIAVTIAVCSAHEPMLIAVTIAVPMTGTDTLTLTLTLLTINSERPQPFRHGLMRAQLPSRVSGLGRSV